MNKKINKKIYLKIAERSFDLRTSGLWAQHASTAPLCSTVELYSFRQKPLLYYSTNLNIAYSTDKTYFCFHSLFIFSLYKFYTLKLSQFRFIFVSMLLNIMTQSTREKLLPKPQKYLYWKQSARRIVINLPEDVGLSVCCTKKFISKSIQTKSS